MCLPVMPVERLMCCVECAAVECRSRRVKLPICVDTSSRSACLNRTSWQALAPEEDVSHWDSRRYVRGKVHGIEVDIHFGQGLTAGVNAVGATWLAEGGLILVADYARQGCALIKSDEQYRKRLSMLPRVYE